MKANIACNNLNISSYEVFNLFQQYQNHPFLFVKPGGNHGDELIYKGAEKIANMAGIHFQSADHHEFMNTHYPHDVIIYIHGSGGYTPFWSGNPISEFQKSVDSHNGITVLGPTTFINDLDFVRENIISAIHKSHAKDIHIFARERKSYAILEEILPKWSNLQLDHDTALNLCADDFGPVIPRFKYILHAIREDKEGVHPIERDVLSVWLDPIMHCSSFEHWIVLHRRAQRIITNRLHSSIAGSIFGVPTILTPNSYHKNRSVWEYSLYQRGVEWADEIPIGKLAHLLNHIGPVKKMFGSSMFQKAIRAFIYRARYKYLAEQ